MTFKHDSTTPFDFDKLKIVDYTADQNTSSSIAEIIVPIGVSHKLSWSKRSDKYYYVVEGNVTFTVSGDSDSLSSGDVCIIPKGTRFSYRNTGPSDVKLILIHTPPFDLESEVFID